MRLIKGHLIIINGFHQSVLFKNVLTLLIIGLHQSVWTMDNLYTATYSRKSHWKKMFAHVCDFILIFPHIKSVADLGGRGYGGGGGGGSPNFLVEKDGN